MQWRLIDSGSMDPYWNMAVDEAILEAVAAGQVPPTLRFYAWQPPGLSLGYFQRLQQEVDLVACQRLGVKVVRRLTGGRAVLHEHELTYSLIAPQDHPAVSGSVLESYLKISRGLLTGLKNLGIDACLAEGKSGTEPASSACFDAPSRYELTVEGKKLVGSAQTRKQGVVLQHGSILVRLETEKLFACLRFPSEEMRRRLLSNFHQRAITIGAILGREPEYEELVNAFTAGFSQGLGIELQTGLLTEQEKAQAAMLVAEKYSQESWNNLR
ncbi:hypothetical protein ULO1_04030 [Carboxydocella sp. ULO1]|nr:lipoate--protein ligase family protein [Carboxydocella sp. ULO1]GAW27833.1 hypothetical protein ULO1_04030 [Carboxydocella sp. ULO1]